MIMSIAPEKTLFDEITDFLAASPTAEQILAFKASEAMGKRLHDLLDKNSLNQITVDERAELDEFLRLDHFVTMLKLKTRLKIAGKL